MFFFTYSSSLRCYEGDKTNQSVITCPEQYSDFCTIYEYNDECEDNICTELGCVDDRDCEEPGTSKQEKYGMNFTLTCCDTDLCNLKV